MYKLSFKVFNKIQWIISILLLVVYCPLFFQSSLSMLNIILFHPYITLVLNNLFIYYEDKKASLVLNMEENLISRLGYKQFINKYIIGCFLEMFIYFILVYGTLALFQFRGMTGFEKNLLPSVLLLNGMFYLFLVGCFCMKPMIKNYFLDRLLTFIPVILNIIFHYNIIQSIYQPLFNMQI